MVSVEAEEYPMMSFLEPLSPVLLFGITILYLLFVLKLGPYLMKTQQPYKMTTVLVIYNVSQILINAFLFVKGLKVSLNIGIHCIPTDDHKQVVTIFNLQHKFFLLKLYDLLETIFFVLRKKQDQINFLHVYHHVCLYSSSWIGAKYFPVHHGWPAGPLLVCALCNALVHVVMYTYYMFTALNISNAKNSWWKKYVTLMQVIQLIFILFVVMLLGMDQNCRYPKYLLALCLVNLVVIIYLFIRYFQENYVKKSKN